MSWCIQIIIQFGNFENPNIIIRDYVQLAFTLFGFTLIGGIFERRSNKGKSKVVGRLFFISLIFLFSAMSFLLSYALFSGIITNSWYELPFKILFGAGALSFSIAILLLLFVLVNHYVKDYLKS